LGDALFNQGLGAGEDEAISCQNSKGDLGRHALRVVHDGCSFASWYAGNRGKDVFQSCLHRAGRIIVGHKAVSRPAWTMRQISSMDPEF